MIKRKQNIGIKMEECNCKNWAHDGRPPLLSHHWRCDAYNPVPELMDIISELLKCIEQQDYCNIYNSSAYKKAKTCLGQFDFINKNITAKVGNLLEEIENEELDGIQNAANCIGPMGAGIAGAIRSEGGIEIQNDAFRVCILFNPEPGQAYSTISGSLKERGIKRIIHAATMKTPGGETSLEIVESAFKSALKLAKEGGIKRLGCTALGTGIGGLDSKEVAKIMYNVAKNEKLLDIVFIDFNKDFIEQIKKNLKNET